MIAFTHTVLIFRSCSSSRYFIISARVPLSQIRLGFSVLLFSSFNNCKPKKKRNKIRLNTVCKKPVQFKALFKKRFQSCKHITNLLRCTTVKFSGQVRCQHCIKRFLYGRVFWSCLVSF